MAPSSLLHSSSFRCTRGTPWPAAAQTGHQAVDAEDVWPTSHPLYCPPVLPSVLQATRQSMLKKYGEIRHAMDRLHNTRLSNYERIECLDDIRRWAPLGGGS